MPTSVVKRSCSLSARFAELLKPMYTAMHPSTFDDAHRHADVFPQPDAVANASAIVSWQVRIFFFPTSSLKCDLIWLKNSMRPWNSRQ